MYEPQKHYTKKSNSRKTRKYYESTSKKCPENAKQKRNKKNSYKKKKHGGMDKLFYISLGYDFLDLRPKQKF